MTKSSFVLGTLALLICVSPTCWAADEWVNPNSRWSTIGPPDGTLLIDGGNDQGGAVKAFLSLVGDLDAPIVVIPTAGADANCGEDGPAARSLRQQGAKNVKVLHTRRRTVANSPEFAELLRQAKGVWISGGQQSQLAMAYLHTRTHRELFGVLERGGVIAGTSAGASIQGSFLYGGHAGGDVGFGFVRDSAIGQHFIRRRRHLPETSGLTRILSREPELLGIGLDEETFIVVRGDVFEVGGESKVVTADASRPDWSTADPYTFLFEGDRYDMRHRRVVRRTSETVTDTWENAGKEWVDPASEWTTLGPPKGTLLLAGAYPTPAIVSRFVEAAGRRDGRIVVIPTADARRRERPNPEIELLAKSGAKNVTVWHTIDPDAANSPAFVEPLRKADAVWICGGDQWRLADAYLHTLAHKELFEVLRRGGIVAGSGSGARFLAHRMTGDAYGWHSGCGLLRDSLVHTWLAKNRPMKEMVAILKKEPALLGIGIDERTAVLIHANQLEVIGKGDVAVCDAKRPGWPWEGDDDAFLLLEPAERYDLKTRRPEWMIQRQPAAD
ncbi:MAG TPA: hypothetical protein DD670_20830 [Planctomycetaceae bacterium]|nr:hypothetical protein [Planctomycetaceae bacterium]